MNPSAKGLSGLLLSSCAMIYGCSKSTIHSDPGLPSGARHAAKAYFTTDTTQFPFYGDTILYLKSSGSAGYLFSPVNHLGAGIFVSWPAGLSVNRQTGVIDASKSEPGSRYNIGFVSSPTGDTAYSQVIISGVTYPDGIYYMDAPEAVIQPFYNAAAPATGISPADLRTTDQQLLVNTGNGAIDLKTSVRQGLFGGHPQNGDTRQIAVYYRLNDRSGMNLQKTSLTLHYYNTLADVPASLIATCQSSQSAFPQINTQTVSDGASSGEKAVTATTPIKEVATNLPVPKPAPVAPRPPQIVIVNVGHR
jgi:hypothetical protein